jgi:hypothetical protein
MSLIQLHGRTADLYREWLAYFEARGNVTYVERTQAYLNATAGNPPRY